MLLGGDEAELIEDSTTTPREQNGLCGNTTAKRLMSASRKACANGANQLSNQHAVKNKKRRKALDPILIARASRESRQILTGIPQGRAKQLWGRQYMSVQCWKKPFQTKSSYRLRLWSGRHWLESLRKLDTKPHRTMLRSTSWPTSQVALNGRLNWKGLFSFPNERRWGMQGLPGKHTKFPRWRKGSSSWRKPRAERHRVCPGALRVRRHLDEEGRSMSNRTWPHRPLLDGQEGNPSHAHLRARQTSRRKAWENFAMHALPETCMVSCPF